MRYNKKKLLEISVDGMMFFTSEDDNEWSFYIIKGRFSSSFNGFISKKYLGNQ